MIRINDSNAMTTLKAAVLVTAFLLCAAVTGFGQQVVNLTAGPDTTTPPDGTTLSGSSSGAATGSLAGIYVLNSGSGYAAPSVTIAAPGCTINTTTCIQATANPVVNGGKVVGFNVTSHGVGYTSAPAVTITDTAGAVPRAATGLAWSPVLITVPYGATGGLQINLTNNLSFTAGATTNNIPTSIIIVGQVGGGLGTTPILNGSATTSKASPLHTDVQG